MIEYIQLLLTLGAILMVMLSCLALAVRLVFAPLMALLAVPTYAAMVSLENLIASHRRQGCPAPLQFQKPKTFWKKLCMDFCATYCTLAGCLIAFRLFEPNSRGASPDAGLAKLIANSSDSGQFTLIGLFWASLVAVYVVSYLHGDGPEHPMNKFEDLLIPEWAKKLAEKLLSK